MFNLCMYVQFSFQGFFANPCYFIIITLSRLNCAAQLRPERPGVGARAGRNVRTLALWRGHATGIMGLGVVSRVGVHRENVTFIM